MTEDSKEIGKAIIKKIAIKTGHRCSPLNKVGIEYPVHKVILKEGEPIRIIKEEGEGGPADTFSSIIKKIEDVDGGLIKIETRSSFYEVRQQQV